LEIKRTSTGRQSPLDRSRMTQSRHPVCVDFS
jgi:hypothetical protein